MKISFTILDNLDWSSHAPTQNLDHLWTINNDNINIQFYWKKIVINLPRFLISYTFSSLFQISECSKSEGPSLSTSPGSDFLTSPAHKSNAIPLTAKHFSRTSSRTSQNSLQSPSKSTGSSPPKSGSSGSLNKFHNRLVDKLKRSLLRRGDDGCDDQRNLSWNNQGVSGRPPPVGSKPIDIRRTSIPGAASFSGASEMAAHSCPDSYGRSPRR